MELTLKIENKKMYNSFVQFFNSLGIKMVSFKGQEKSKIKQTYFDNVTEKKSEINLNNKSNSGLDDVFGIWKGQNITLEKIRQQQWGKRIR